MFLKRYYRACTVNIELLNQMTVPMYSYTNNANIVLNKNRLYSTNTKSRTALYDTLEVTPSASQSLIKASYYRLSKKYHPDVNKTEQSNRKFIEVSNAYEILGNRKSRKLYDQGLRSSFRPSTNNEDESHNNIGRHKFKSKTGPVYGRTDKFDFDEFYRKHYGESIRKRKEAKLADDDLEKEERQVKLSRRRSLLVYFGLLSSFTLFILFKNKR